MGERYLETTRLPASSDPAEASSVSGEVAGSVGVELETELHEIDEPGAEMRLSQALREFPPAKKAFSTFHAVGCMWERFLTHVHSVLSRLDNV